MRTLRLDNKIRAGRFVAAFVILMALVGISGFGTISAGANSANNTLYWNTAPITVCSYCTLVVLVVGMPNTQTPPTTVAGEMFADPSMCLECVQENAVGAVNAYGYWFAGDWFINETTQSGGVVGFLLDFTNGS